MRFVIIIGSLIISISTIGQSRKDWTQLDFLNKDPDYPFETEKDISGVCFVIMSEMFSVYEKPIIIKSKDNKEILKIVFSELNGLTTTFNGQSYLQFDNQNPFNPWLFVDNPDYFRLAFECVDTIGTSYKVKLNDKEFAHISKAAKDFKKQSIPDFVKDWTSLGLDFDRTTNPLREVPNSDGKIINHSDEKKYKIWCGESLEVNGDWVKINTLKNEVGWVKWRDRNKVIIRMYFAC